MSIRVLHPSVSTHPLAIYFVTCGGVSFQRTQKYASNRHRLGSSHLIQAVSTFPA